MLGILRIVIIDMAVFPHVGFHLLISSNRFSDKTDTELVTWTDIK